MMRLTSSTFSIDAAPDGSAKRTITGIALPYNVEATVLGGQVVSFLPGSLPVEGKKPKLYMSHDASQAIGLVTERSEDKDAMYFVAKVSSTALGDEALVLAADGVLDSVSVGVNPTVFTFNDDGVMIVEAAEWLELSLVPQGAFEGSIITDVAASIHPSDTNLDNNNDKAPDEPDTTNTEETKVNETPAPEVIEAQVVFAQPKRKFNLPTPGEYMAAMHIGGTTFENVSAAAREFMQSQQTAIQAAPGDITTTDVDGLLPVPVLGPVFQDLNFIRPVVTAIGARAMPGGGRTKTFIRPTITTHTSVAAQAAEFDAVSATTMVIADNVISKTTLSGQVTLSVQSIDFTDPAALDIILNDLVGKYLLATDTVACTAITAGASASGATWNVTAGDPTTLIAGLYTAAANMLGSTNFLPDHLFVSANVWKELGMQLDADNRPIFPYVGAAGLTGVNGVGTANITQLSTYNPFGLQLIADSNFATDTLVVAKGSAIEFYEQVRGLMSVELPSTLGRNLSYAGFVSTFIADDTLVQSIIVA